MEEKRKLSRKALASIAFGIGSFILMADALVAVLRKADEVDGGNLFKMGFPSVLGYIGLLSWAAGILLLVLDVFKGREKGSMKRRQVFLRGREEFRCHSCGRDIEAKGVGYHQRRRCSCGAEFDLYQDLPGEGMDLKGPSGRSYGGPPMRTGNTRARKRSFPPPSR